MSLKRLYELYSNCPLVKKTKVLSTKTYLLNSGWSESFMAASGVAVGRQSPRRPELGKFCKTLLTLILGLQLSVGTYLITKSLADIPILINLFPYIPIPDAIRCLRFFFIEWICQWESSRVNGEFDRIGHGIGALKWQIPVFFINHFRTYSITCKVTRAGLFDERLIAAPVEKKFNFLSHRRFR